MKKLLLPILLVLLAPLFASAGNDYINEAYSFEPYKGKVGGYWWIQPPARKFVSISDEQAFDGKYSLKIDATTLGDDTSTGAMSITNALFSLKQGEYTMSLYVYVVEAGAVGFSTNISEDKGKNFQNVGWKFGQIETGKWVQLTKVVNLKSTKGAKISVQHSSNPKWGGKGTYYIDSITIVKNL